MAKELLLYATGSAHPIDNANITYFVTADTMPIYRWFMMGACFGAGIVLITIGFLIWLERALYRKYGGS